MFKRDSLRMDAIAAGQKINEENKGERVRPENGRANFHRLKQYS